jgi:hypothetical protein
MTDSQIDRNLQIHYAANNPGAPKKYLFLFFSTTGGVASNYQEVVNTADLVFHAVRLTYPNGEAVNELRAALPVGKFGSLGDAKAQAAAPGEKKTNSFNY